MSPSYTRKAPPPVPIVNCASAKSGFGYVRALPLKTVSKLRNRAERLWTDSFLFLPEVAVKTRSYLTRAKSYRRKIPVVNSRVGLKMSAYKTLSSADDICYFRPATLADLERISELEADGYPHDEAASTEQMRYRLTEAGELFLAAVRGADDTVIGYTCSTATKKEQLNGESMSVHEPDGPTVCIHSVCVEEKERRKGVATRMLRAYTQWVSQSFPRARALRLICKKEKIGLYERAGFRLLGPSAVVHGQDPWFEMELVLGEA
uniref:Arylalkylamine n-acetyltransferase n=1 Tax=Tetraselmis sp. GSL018 TaxID=582737 RepID=A0A061S597_9CHLO